MTSLTAWIVYGVAGLVPVLLHLRATRRAHAAAELALAESRTSRLTAPPSLHPAINPNRCLGCGSCVGACPEGDVLGLIAGKAMLVNPTHCIGHGACREACPTDAITLVLGTEERGVDVPHLGPDFQTNVPGLFVAGELGGMGLIRNAVEQGRQAVDSIRRLSGIGGGDGLDLVVVGAGPAGLAASLAARQHSLRVVTLEQDSLGGAVAHYPRGKLVMTAPLELPGFGRIAARDITKESLLGLWQEVVRTTGVRIRTEERVESVMAVAGGFEVKSSRGQYHARSVLLAIGRRGTPARLDVPGEDLPNVVYRLIDPEQYRGQRVLVVGGGDSALEAALRIAGVSGTQVSLSYRGEAFARARPKNRAQLEATQAAGRVRVLLGSRVVEIRTDAVRLGVGEGELDLANDAVVICVGGVLPDELLRSIGVALETKHGTPVG